MVKIWQMDDFDQGDPRLPHFAFPPKYITPERLKKRTGVFLWKIGLETEEATATQMEWIIRDNKFVMDDVTEIKEGITTNLDRKIKEWFVPHMHTLAESRLIVDGQTYYDVEDPRTEKWYRVLLEKGDFIIIPAACIHRFTTDTTNYVKMKRFFQAFEKDPHTISVALSKVHDARLEYLKSFNITPEVIGLSLSPPTSAHKLIGPPHAEQPAGI